MYRKVPRISSPPPPPPPKKIVSRLNERIFVIMNAAACRSLKSCWSTIPFLKCGNRYAEALTITKIRSFKHEPFFFGGGGGGGGGGGAYSWYFTVHVRHIGNTFLHIGASADNSLFETKARLSHKHEVSTYRYIQF